MIDLVRSLFGWSKAASGRTVLGHPGLVGAREAAYIRDSNTRLNTLFQLCNRYQGTPHALKIRSVYEKTKSIHTLLVARRKIRELELFHIQNTDHFINTFTVILEAHPRFSPLAAGHAEAGSSRTIKESASSRTSPLNQGHAPVSPTVNGRWMALSAGSGTQIPRLTAPGIRINPAARILYYLTEPTPDGNITREIALSSAPEEKESFLAHVAGRFGITGMAYLGNALVNIADTSSPTPTGLVAIIQWHGHPYAVNFTDGRLFPVKLPA